MARLGLLRHHGDVFPRVGIEEKVDVVIVSV